MKISENPLMALTAGDLMSRELTTVSAGMSLREAAVRLARAEVHGAPVVDGEGRCVGVLSVSDLARWAAGGPRHAGRAGCAFQSVQREPGGRESTLCALPAGACPLQRLREAPDGTLAVTCAEPAGVPTEWQVLEPESLPPDAVRECMTTAVVSAAPAATVPELARLMLERRVHRVFVLDAGRRPVGVVTVSDLLQVLAHPELATAGDPR
jgi:CBS domain-containing protein